MLHPVDPPVCIGTEVRVQGMVDQAEQASEKAIAPVSGKSERRVPFPAPYTTCTSCATTSIAHKTLVYTFFKCELDDAPSTPLGELPNRRLTNGHICSQLSLQL